MAEGGHVVAGKTEGMVQSSQRQLDIFASLSFQFPERVKATLAILSVDGDREIEFTSEIPQRVVFRLVQPFTDGQKRISDGHGAQLFYGAASLLDHLADVGAGQHGDKLEALGINAAVIVGPIIVCPAHGGAEMNVFQGHAISEVAVVAGGQQDLNIPTVAVHIFEANLRGPPLPVSFAIFLFHDSPRALRRSRLDLASGNKFPVGFVDHENAIHESNLRDLVSVLRLDVTVP